MVRQVSLRPRALADLDAIWAYTAENWGPGQAVTYLSGLDAAFALLAEFPEIARLRDEFRPPVRLHPYREHLVIFTAEPEAIDVLRVVHSRADWAAFLSE